MNSKNTNPKRKTFNKVNRVQKLIESMPIEHLNLTSLLNNNKDIKVVVYHDFDYEKMKETWVE